MSERMNKKQAIKQVENVRHQVEVMLKDYRNVFDDIFSDDDIQALDIAIESLDNEQKKASITLEELKNKYDKKLEKALAECETGVQANAICEVTNVLIDYILDNEWQTDTPQESGFYLVTNGAKELDIRKYDSGWYHDMHRRYSDEELKIIAWRKIEPFKRDKE